jgi:hypothetical protein
MILKRVTASLIHTHPDSKTLNPDNNRPPVLFVLFHLFVVVHLSITVLFVLFHLFSPEFTSPASPGVTQIFLIRKKTPILSCPYSNYYSSQFFSEGKHGIREA